MPELERPNAMTRARGVFDRFAERSSEVVGQALFFTTAFALVVIWMPLVVVFESVDTWQLVLNTLTSVVAFLLIALLQNSERRNDRALHRKLDVLAIALAAYVSGEATAGRPELARAVDELRASVKLEQEI